MPVKLSSTGGGSVTLDTPSTASNYTVTLPTANTTLADTSSTQTLTNKTIASLATTGTATFGGIIDTGSTGQIQFPATQNPSSNANTLDDYEEGTWTPFLATSGTPGSWTYSVQRGSYTKIGNTIVLCGEITVSAVTSATGTYLRIGGVPFALSSAAGSAAIGGASGSFGPWSGFSGLATGVIPVIGASNGTDINIWSMNGNGGFGTGMGGANTTASTAFYFELTGRI